MGAGERGLGTSTAVGGGTPAALAKGPNGVPGGGKLIGVRLLEDRAGTPADTGEGTGILFVHFVAVAALSVAAAEAGG